jgi:hypothetical protein
MVTTQIVQITITKGDLNFVFNMPATATWGTAIDATNDLLAAVCDMAKQAIGTQSPTPVEAIPETSGDTIVIDPIVEGTQDGN